MKVVYFLLFLFGLFIFFMIGANSGEHRTSTNPPREGNAAATVPAPSQPAAPDPRTFHFEYRGVMLGMDEAAARAALAALASSNVRQPKVWINRGRVYAIQQEILYGEDLAAYAAAFTEKYGPSRLDQATYLIEQNGNSLEVHGQIGTWNRGTETLQLMERCDGGNQQERYKYISCVALYAPEYAPKSAPPI